MEAILFEKLHAQGLISDGSLEKVKASAKNKLFSLHWELRTILYLGVLLLSGGLGILVYKNIDTIGHTAILMFIALVCAGGFWYCFKTKLPFSTGRVVHPIPFLITYFYWPVSALLLLSVSILFRHQAYLVNTML